MKPRRFLWQLFNLFLIFVKSSSMTVFRHRFLGLIGEVAHLGLHPWLHKSGVTIVSASLLGFTASCSAHLPRMPLPRSIS